MPRVELTRLAAAWSPRDAALCLARTPGLAWLDGGLEHGREGRFSFLATAPCEVRESAPGERSLALLDQLAECAPDRAALAPFTADDIPRWVGHIGYDAGLGGVLQKPRDSLVPALRFARYDAWLAFDHAEGAAYVLGDDARASARLLERLQQPPLEQAALDFHAGPVSATSSARHSDAIRAALALIREGEVYEINLARRFRAPFAGSALGLFLRMRERSPVPLGYFCAGEGHAVLGRSMERFLRFRRGDRALWTSPIKGTIARTGDDAGESTRLRGDPKEHAEHAMVVDLMRNDLSRVCEVGTVSIDALMEVLPFAGLSHLVSTVRGRAHSELGLREVLARTFPPGSVTGAPKERVVRAIEELEEDPRGLYTGCMGFVDRAGGCSFAVAIRTAVVERDTVTYFAGGGIVADSVPERELAETELKAELFLRALE